MRPASQFAPLAEINVTPLVDIMLVLLIIFMVAAPFLDQGIPVELPAAATSSDVGAGGSKAPLVITLSKEHVVYLNDKSLSFAELRKQLANMQERPVTIRADRYAYVDKLVALWDLCREQGFRQVHIVTTSE